MFHFSLFILDSSLPSLASLLFSLAIGLRLSPLLSTSRLLSRLNITFICCFLSEYRTLLLHTTLWTPFDIVPLSPPLCIAYIVLLWTQSYIHTPRPVSSKLGSCGPDFPLPFCVRFRATVAHYRLIFVVICVPSSLLLFDPIPPIVTRHSHLRTRAFRLLVISSSRV